MSKTCTTNWKQQRYTGMMLVPLGLWFIWILSRTSGDYLSQVNVFSTIPFIFFVGVSIVHGYLGILEVVEDYVPKPGMRKVIKALWTIFTIGLIGVFGLSNLKITSLSRAEDVQIKTRIQP